MSKILLPIVYVLVFVAAVAIIQAGASLVFSSRDRARSVNRRLTMLDSGMTPDDVYSQLIRQPKSPFTPGGRLFDLHEAASVYFRQAGLTISPLGVLTNVAAAALAIWLLSLLLVRTSDVFGFILNGVASFLASCLLCGVAALLWFGRRRAKRLKALEEQMPVALDVINRAIRAGHPVVAAVQLAASEMGDPIGSEFGLIVDETTYGFAFKDALFNFARRSGSADAHFFAISVGIQAETGGNLAEILEGLATVIRGRMTLAKRVKALSSEGRASAILLSVLPIFTIAAIFLIRPAYYTSKFSDPIFWPVAGGVFLLYLTGWILIRRIINFRY
jgi:tight adherence protein B